jgi:amino acid permease
LIGIAATECERQRTVLPKAVRRVSYRVVIYYVGAVIVLGLNLSADDPILRLNLGTGRRYSPYALMFDRAGIPVLRNIVNAVALIASSSCANTALYLGVSRPLYSLIIDYRAELCTLWRGKSKLLKSF